MNKSARKVLGLATVIAIGLTVGGGHVSAQPLCPRSPQLPGQPLRVSPDCPRSPRPPEQPLFLPSVLRLDYTILSGVGAARAIAIARNTPSRITSMAAIDHCRLTVDFATRPPHITISGTPGRAGFNIAVTAGALTSNPPIAPSCLALNELQLVIGSSSGTIVVGGPTPIASGHVTAADGTLFNGFAVFDGRLTGFDAQRRVTGDFRFIAIDSANPLRILAVEGSYGFR